MGNEASDRRSQSEQRPAGPHKDEQGGVCQAGVSRIKQRIV